MLQVEGPGWRAKANISDLSPEILAKLRKIFPVGDPQLRACSFQQGPDTVQAFQILFDFGTAMVIITPKIAEVNSQEFIATLHTSVFIERLTGIRLEPVVT